MKQKGIHKPTIEDIIELSGIEALHPGGMDLTRRTAELAQMKPRIKVLDVSSHDFFEIISEPLKITWVKLIHIWE